MAVGTRVQSTCAQLEITMEWVLSMKAEQRLVVAMLLLLDMELTDTLGMLLLHDSLSLYLIH